METMRKKFNILGVVLTFTIVIGLVVQYIYLNKIVEKEKQHNLTTIREHLGENINNIINSYNHYIAMSADIIGANEWSDYDLTQYVTKLAQSNSVIKSVYYGEKTNKLINSDNWTPPGGYDVRERPWYIQAATKNGLVISDVYTAAIDGSTVISISKPVYHEGNFVGVIAADIAVEEIIKMVEKTRVQGSGYSILIDGSGNILAHPSYKYNLGSGLIHIDSLGAEIYEKIRDMKMGQIKTRLDGVDGYLTFRFVKNTNWIIANFISVKNFKGNNNALWGMFFIALTISMVMFFSFASIQRRSFLIPVLQLEEDIEKINLENNSTYRIPLKMKDPFKSIKETLNSALSKSQNLLEQVEQDKYHISMKNKELNYLSYNDQLTGLYNRRYFEEQLPLLDIEENLPISLIMGDANGLKLINDSFGHKAGDNLLITIANIIKKACRPHDIVTRISGDEFVVILLKTDKNEARTSVEKIKELSKKERVVTHKFSDIEISMSYGFDTKYNAKTSIFDTLKVAEDNMYSNKLFEGPGMRKRTIETILQELYKREGEKEKHILGVAMIARKLGTELGMKEEEIKALENLARVCDIGEITIEETVFNKSNQLTDQEWTEIKKHPEIGYRILSTVGEMSNIAYHTLSHHERYDGKGYPKGLKGKDIPLASRIIAIADAYTAMQVNRPYRPALKDDDIIAEIRDKASSQFDPELTKLLVEKVLKKEWI